MQPWEVLSLNTGYQEHDKTKKYGKRLMF